MKKLFLFTVIIVSQLSLAQEKRINSDCFAVLENNVLTIGNSLISRNFKWNNGNIITSSLTDKVSGKVWKMNSNIPDLSLPGQAENAQNASCQTKIVSETAIAPEHLVVEITYSLDNLDVKRLFRIYSGSAAIACDLYFKGKSKSVWLQPGTSLADMINLEKLTASGGVSNAPVIEKIELPGRHWTIDAVEFLDVTDRYNTLVFNVEALSFRRNYYRGNMLFAHDKVTDNGIFILKEAPTSNVQLAYPGGDFMTEYGTFRVLGTGINPNDLSSSEWRRGYGFVTGVYAGNEQNRYVALRNYQNKIRTHKPGRDEMILMNTWGDRSGDSRLNEKFALDELEAGAKLGITHFQLDAGWQAGRPSNSALKDNILYWEPSSSKFPNGLETVVKRGKELGIEICLWFSPSKDYSNARWEEDADVLIGLYKKYGIHTFKIDLVNLPDKLSEINFRKFLDKVNLETNDNVVFNLDVTAQRRGGYNYFNEYGNLFLENRYTDWQNYYPYTTLRNLWMLSKYIPAQNFQIEFLNKWRNVNKYNGDPFAPANYSFEYLFAITMAAQPLAWFEGTGLTEDAISEVAPVIKKYREIQFDFHSGNIFPIGNEPSGRSWTGFQSVQDGKGYFLIFRENNDSSNAEIKTWLRAEKKIICTPIIGKGKAFSVKVGVDGVVKFVLPLPNTYTLYKYQIQ